METLEVTSEQFDALLDLSEFVVNGIAYSKEGIRAYFVEIGPELARAILQTYRTDYRKLRPRHAESIATDMREGNWNLDGSPIRMSDTQELIDGQHRLTGITLTGIRQEFLVVDTLPVSTYDTIDTNGIPRNYVDVLRRRGYTNCSNRAALAKLIWYWDHRNSLDGRQALTVAQLDSVHENPAYKERIKWAVNNSQNLDRRIYARKSAIALAMFVLGEISQLSILELMNAVAVGEGLYRGQPTFALWNRFRNDHNNEKEKIRTTDETVWLIFRAWQTYHKNTMRDPSDPLTMGKLTLPPQGVTVRDLKAMLETE